MIKIGGLVNIKGMWLNESEDDKYTHIGYGHYKLKGKEKDPNATVFSKEGNKYVPTKGDDKSADKSKAEPAKPKVNIFDKPKTAEPSTKAEPEKPKVNIFDKPNDKKERDTPQVGDKVTITTPSLGKQYIGMHGEINPRKLGNGKYSVKLDNGMDMAFSADEFKHNSINPRWGTSVDKSSTNKHVPSTKLKTLMPKSNPKTFSGQSDIGKVSPKQKREISMKIDELDRISKEARAKGEQAPNFNLCKITVPGTNLYCDQNLGVPREEMPQFKGKPQPMSPAAKMKVDANGEVDTEPLFKKMLVKKGIKTYNTEIPSDALKATQSELVGAKVAGMTKALEENPNNPGITAPIYVSRDGYVIDGHHRWAAVTSMAISQGKPANMKVIVIDDDARNIIPMANKFAQDIGVAAKKADANQEAPVKPVREGDKKLNNFTQSLAKKSGITPQKLGKEKYQKTMMQAAVAALTDSNYHDEARKLVAKLENKPEFEKNPTERKDYVPYGKPGYDDFRKTTAWSSDYFDADENTDKFATTISTQSGWEGDSTIDAIASDLRKNGFNDLASKLQSIVENKSTTSLMKMIKEATGHPDKEIAHYTGTRATAVGEFIEKFNINGDKLAEYVRKGKMPERMKFVSALVGNPNNKSQQEIIQKFGNK